MAKLTAGKELLYATFSIGLLFLAIPLMPTKWVINPHSLTVVDDHVIFDRSVLFPVTGHVRLEWERLSPPPPTGQPSCNSENVVPYERRKGVPYTWIHDCDLTGPPGAQWQLRMCIQAEVIFSILMRPACITTTFYPDAPNAIQQSRSLSQDIKDLTREVETLKQSVED